MKDFLAFICFFVLFPLIILYIFILCGNNIRENSFERGYIQACKDNYKGKLKYHLVENDDGTKEWKLKLK